MNTLDAVILDLGNVLAFHDNDLLFRRLGEAWGRDETLVRETLEALWEPINRGHLAREALHEQLSKTLESRLSFERFVELWSSHFTVHREMVEVVEGLVGRVRLVLLSNTNALHFEYLRPRLPVLEHFDALVLSHETGLVKPEAAIYRAAERLSGARPGRAIFFDDLAPYVEAAREAGLQAEIFTTAESARERILEGLKAS